MTRKIQVIINPVAGQPTPILNTLNDVFYKAGVDWDIAITMQPRDGMRFAQEAVAAGVDVVAVYGGDGTQLEVAEGLQGSGIPLAILPGGSANFMAKQLSVPLTLSEAATLATLETLPIYGIDVGQISGEFGESLFMLRVFVGPETDNEKLAVDSLTDKNGLLAYSVAAVKALTKADKATYQVTVNGRSTEVEGVSCLVDNSGNMGFRDISFAEAMEVQDAFLDSLVIRDLSFRSHYSVEGNIGDLKTESDTFAHWRARELTIDAEPAQYVYADGRIIGKTPLIVQALSQKMPVLSPLATGQLMTTEPQKIDLNAAKKKEADHRLIIVKYPSRQVAEQSLARIKQLKKEQSLSLVDAVLVEKNKKGKLIIEPIEGKTTKKGLARGSAVGLLVGVVAAGAVLPLVIAGGAIGALWGKRGGRALEKRLTEELGTVLEEGEAAICTIVDFTDWQNAEERTEAWGGEIVTAEISDEEYALLSQVAEEPSVATAVTDDQD